jgi:DNA invertase Pin-like site-specific DNA recombinase
MATIVRAYTPAKKKLTTAELWNTVFPLNVQWAIYARQSTYAQIGNESTEMQTEDLKQWLIQRGVKEGYIHLYDADLGKSGTLRIDQRIDLNRLLSNIKAGKIKAVLVYRVSRLFRDLSGVQYNMFADECAKQNCILVTADGMLFNFNNPQHLQMFRYLAQQAADYLAQQMEQLFEARVRKARRGLYVGFGLNPWGIIVDYNTKSPTYQQRIVYKPHAAIVLDQFRRNYALEGDFYTLSREVDAMPLLFPEFEDWVDERNIPKKKRKRVPGGYHISDYGLRLLLTNPFYIGWLIVMGDVISREMDYRIIPIEEEYLFWYSFDLYARYNLDGHIRETEDETTPRRFYQKHTNPQALLNKKKLTSPYGFVSVHPTRYGYAYSIATAADTYNSVREQITQVHTPPVDDEFSTLFLRHLRDIRELEGYHRFIQEQTQHITDDLDTLNKALAKIDEAQEAILSERLAMQKQINQEEDAEKREQARKEAAPDLERLRKRAAHLDTTAAQIRLKIQKLEESGQRQTAQTFASFQVEVERLTHVWHSKPMNIRAEFATLFYDEVRFTIVSPHWLQLDIFWRYPGWGQDTVFLYRQKGVQPQWTDEEREVVRANYPYTTREAMLPLLPNKSWRSIKDEAQRLGIARLNKFREEEVPTVLTWQDVEFMRQEGITDLSTKYVSSSLL